MPDSLSLHSPSIAMPEPGELALRARAALREALPSLITEISWKLSGVLDQLAYATIEARADGSGHAPAAMRDEAHKLTRWLAEMAMNAEAFGLDWQGLLPPRLSVDLASKRISFNVASS